MSKGLSRRISPVAYESSAQNFAGHNDPTTTQCHKHVSSRDDLNDSPLERPQGRENLQGANHDQDLHVASLSRAAAYSTNIDPLPAVPMSNLPSPNTLDRSWLTTLSNHLSIPNVTDFTSDFSSLQAQLGGREAGLGTTETHISSNNPFYREALHQEPGAGLSFSEGHESAHGSLAHAKEISAISLEQARLVFGFPDLDGLLDPDSLLQYFPITTFDEPMEPYYHDQA
jgi:hypothetical protein